MNLLIVMVQIIQFLTIPLFNYHTSTPNLTVSGGGAAVGVRPTPCNFLSCHIAEVHQ